MALQTFQHIIQWLQEAQEHADPNLVMTLVGNKADLVDKREVTYHIWEICYVSMGGFRSFLDFLCATGIDAVFKTPGVQNKVLNPPVKTLQFPS